MVWITGVNGRDIPGITPDTYNQALCACLSGFFSISVYTLSINPRPYSVAGHESNAACQFPGICLLFDRHERGCHTIRTCGSGKPERIGLHFSSIDIKNHNIAVHKNRQSAFDNY